MENTKKKFPVSCSRCGYCCLHTPCPIALEKVTGAVPGKPCPALAFDDESKQTTCMMFVLAIGIVPRMRSTIEEAFGIGAGCCIKARAVNLALKLATDFSILPEEMKWSLSIMKRQGGTVQ